MCLSTSLCPRFINFYYIIISIITEIPKENIRKSHAVSLYKIHYSDLLQKLLYTTYNNVIFYKQYLFNHSQTTFNWKQYYKRDLCITNITLLL